jgi:cell division protein FtsZ
MKAVVIGVGRRGGNCVGQLTPPPTDDVTVLYADTDADDLEMRSEKARLYLGSSIPVEAFERNNPTFSYGAALDERDTIEGHLKGADVLVLVAGLGGGTGAGGSRGIATIARELNIPVAAVVTRPFVIEGEDRIARGRRGERELKPVVDFYLPFFQDQLVSFAEKGTRVRDLIGVVDEVVRHAVEGILDVCSRGLTPSERGSLGPLSGSGLFSYGVSEQPTGAVEAAKFAFHGPFFEGVPMTSTERLVISLRSKDPLPSSEVERSVEAFLRRTSDDAAHHVSQRTVPSLENKVLLKVFLLGRFGEPTPAMGDFFVPGPNG